MATSEGEAAVAAMLSAAKQTFEALQHGDDATRAERVQRLHAEYEQHWERVRSAAVALDGRSSDAAPAVPTNAAASAEMDALQRERRELRSTLATRNRELKEQIDLLRDLLMAIQVSGTIQ